MKTTLTTPDRKEATKTICDSRIKGRPCNEFIEITSINKSNIKNLPRDIQSQIDKFIGNNKTTILVRRL